jgi:hypothetical protein
MSSTVRQNYKRYDIYNEFVDEYEIFDNYQDMFVFCGCVGYHKDRVEEDDYTGDGEQLWMHFTDKQAYRAAAASIAYQYTDDPEALIEPEIQLEVLAKHAAGGAQYLQKEFGNHRGNPREALLDFIHEADDEQDNETKDKMVHIIQEFDVGSD